MPGHCEGRLIECTGNACATGVRAQRTGRRGLLAGWMTAATVVQGTVPYAAGPPSGENENPKLPKRP